MNPKLIQLSLQFRELWTETLGRFDVHDPEKCLRRKDELLSVLKEVKDIETSRYDQVYFKCLSYLVNALFLGVQGYQQILMGINSEASLNGARLNAEQFLKLSLTLDNSRPSIKHLRKVITEWKETDIINSVATTITAVNKISLPVIVSTEGHPYAHPGKPADENSGFSVDTETEETVVVSIRLYIDSELWANPQIIKPAHQYAISGLIKINKWPTGYDELQLTHVSTTDDSWMILSFPTIFHTGNDEIPISGSIVLKYVQSILDAPHAIRLLARFISKDKEPIYPKIVGYDQLILRVVDPQNFEYPTGYDKLNEKVLDIFSKVKSELPDVPELELHNFLILLSAILNYQGYCFQFGEYKNKADVKEEAFRDNLIRFLSANPRFSSTIIKEGSLAGGRVEINYKGIIAELKVEKLISDRNKLIQDFQQQPIVYASAVSSQLSILCILDLTEKKFASAIAARNVFFVGPLVHGFEEERSSSRVAVVFIDGNTKNPSSY